MTARNHDGTLIVVEDSDWSAATLEFALAGLSGISMTRFRRAEDALRRLEQDADESCRALITDLHLPGMDGFELVRLVRKLKPAGSLPILVVSGDSDPDTPERTKSLGADAYLGKPYSPAKLRATVEKLLDENEDPRFTA